MHRGYLSGALVDRTVLAQEPCHAAALIVGLVAIVEGALILTDSPLASLL